MIEREIRRRIEKQLKSFPGLILTGPRQSGKTTLVKSIAGTKPYFNFETPSTEELFVSDPVSFLSKIKGQGAVFDEVQRVPELPRFLQELIDEDRSPGRFIITGSQNLLLSQQITQSLAGRVALETLYPLTFSEVPKLGTGDFWDVVFRGGYPELNVADCDVVDWQQNYIRTYVERDVRQIKNIGNLTLFRAFLKAIASRSAQLLNKKQLGEDLGISDTTITEWLSLLEASYLVLLLPPYIPSISKRYSHATKVVMLDSGVASSLLGFQSSSDLGRYAFSGFVFEGAIISDIIKTCAHLGQRFDFFYTRNYRGDEIDLVAVRGSDLIGIEIKTASTFSESLLRGFVSLERSGLNFTRKILIWGGKERMESNGIEIIPWFDASRVLV